MTARVAVAAAPLTSRRHTVAAVLVSVAFATVGALDSGWTSVALALWAFPVVVAAVGDAVTARLQDSVVRPGTEVLIVVLVVQAVAVGAGSLVAPLVGAALFGAWFLVAHLIAPAELGYGDVKFAVLLGLGIGVVTPAGVVPAMVLAVIAQLVVCVAQPWPAQRSGLIGRWEAPFGPALAAASFVVVVVAVVGGR